jgi:hypothetical protein
MVMTEIAAHDAALEHDAAQVATWIAEVVRAEPVVAAAASRR